MAGNEKCARGSRAHSREQQDGGGYVSLSASNSTTKTPPKQYIAELMRQADARMEADPARYDLHFKIWLSLYALKNGLPWDGAK